MHKPELTIWSQTKRTCVLDYDAPLSESGDYTPKYYKAIEIIEKYEYPKLKRPLLPTPSAKKAYPALKPTKYIPYESILDQVPAEARFILENPTSMEDLQMNGNSGQSYGYLVHRKKTPARNGTVLTVCDNKIQSSRRIDGIFNVTYIDL